MVYEVDFDGRVIHLKSLEKPESAKKDVLETTTPAVSSSTVPDEDIKMDGTGDKTEHLVESTEKEDLATTSAPDQKAESPKISANDGSWHEHFNIALSSFLSEEAILQVKDMYLEGREPPRVSDAGWAGRSAPFVGDRDGEAVSEAVSEATVIVPDKREGNDRGGRGKRGGRGGRGCGGRGGSSRVDHRKVLSNVRLALGHLICVSQFLSFLAHLFQGNSYRVP